MGRSSEKASGVSVHQEGNRNRAYSCSRVCSNVGNDLTNMLALVWREITAGPTIVLTLAWE